jgi:putative transposase
MRYVHRNPVKAGLVERAQDWRWSSLFAGPMPDTQRVPICTWPVGRRKDWTDWVNQPQTLQEELALKRSLEFNRPFGSTEWTQRMEQVMDLPPLRPRGRPPGKDEHVA